MTSWAGRVLRLYGRTVLLQLSGVPGAGKSTLARAIAEVTPFVVIDTDVLKSALIHAGLSPVMAGPATYAAALAVAADLLAQGSSVVLDSPCRYRELLVEGVTIARDAGVRYGFVELWAEDVSVLLARLDRRTPKISQLASATDPVPGTDWEFGTGEATLQGWQRQLVHPESDCLRLDAEAPSDENLARVLGYLGMDAREHRRRVDDAEG